MKNVSYTFADLNDGFVVAIMIEAAEGHADTVAACIERLVVPTLAEPGVKLFLPYRSPTNPSQFFIYELYVDEAAWGAHQQTAHFKKETGEFVPLTIRRERVPFVPFARV